MEKTLKQISIAALVAALLLGPAHAGTANLMHDGEVPAEQQRLVCYYETDGFMYHYVIDRGYLSRRCVQSIETPFAPVPQGGAVLIKDDIEMHGDPEKLCYYGLAGGRLLIDTVDRRESCPWTPTEHAPSYLGTGTAVLAHKDSLANSTLCFYRSSPSGRPTHYRLISRYSECDQAIDVQRLEPPSRRR